jgi:hypothetical protein
MPEAWPTKREHPHCGLLKRRVMRQNPTSGIPLSGILSGIPLGAGRDRIEPAVSRQTTIVDPFGSSVWHAQAMSPCRCRRAVQHRRLQHSIHEPFLVASSLAGGCCLVGVARHVYALGRTLAVHASARLWGSHLIEPVSRQTLLVDIFRCMRRCCTTCRCRCAVQHHQLQHSIHEPFLVASSLAGGCCLVGVAPHIYSLLVYVGCASCGVSKP